MTSMDCDVVIIGAGPAGTAAAALLRQRGREVIILEREHFPRFSIGESLLPQCMGLLEEAHLLEAVQTCGFQPKNGAVFHRAGRWFDLDFREGFTDDWGTAYQVQRAHFDSVLADAAAAKGAQIRFGARVTAAALAFNRCRVDFICDDGTRGTVRARFCLDASGFGRVLARCLNLDLPSPLPARQSAFAHLAGPMGPDAFDTYKILINTHPQHADVWYWVIPFSGGRCSVGVVAATSRFADFRDAPDAAWKQYIAEDPYLQGLLEKMHPVMATRQIAGYAREIKSLHGDGYAILGNAGEFLDPVFSSGVTIALKSASLAAPVVEQALRGNACDWNAQFAAPLKRGIGTFRALVDLWYEGQLLDIFFFPKKQESITRMLASILAGYAWDEANPLNRNPARTLTALAQRCR